MLDFIQKNEYFDWIGWGLADPNHSSMKGVQDGWILSLLMGQTNLKIAEVGGGKSRILEILSRDNECWNIDKFEGVGAGPRAVPQIPGVKVVRTYLGSFDSDLPDHYFDVVFSISVVEHVPPAGIDPFFEDCKRILKPGGMIAHAIDTYIFDQPNERLDVIDLYRSAIADQGFEWFLEPAIDSSAVFKCCYATNPDTMMNQWNRTAPGLKPVREVAQGVSMKLIAFKKADDDPTLAMLMRQVAKQSLEPRETPVEISFTSTTVISRPAGLTTASGTGAGAIAPVSQPVSSPKAVSSPAAPSPSVNSKQTEAKDEKARLRRIKQRAKRQAKRQAERRLKRQAEQLARVKAQNLAGSRGQTQSLPKRILQYYSRWPSVVAALAIALNATALLVPDYQWAFLAGGTGLLLLMIGHGASKADYVLREVEQVRLEQQRAQAKLLRQMKQIAKRPRKGSKI